MINANMGKFLLRPTWILILMAFKGALPQECDFSGSWCFDSDCYPLFRCTNESSATMQQLNTHVNRNCRSSYVYLEIRQSQIDRITDSTFKGFRNCYPFGLLLRNNHIRSISGRIPYGSLRLLDLSCNELETSKIAESDFSNLHYLKTLNLSYNRIESINSGIFRNLLALSKLDFHNNTIQYIHSSSFQTLPNLQSLDLSCNKIGSSKIEANIFEGLYNLRTLNVSYNQIESIKRDIFQGLTSLSKLYLQYNHIKHIEDSALQTLSGLEYLYIHNNKLGTLTKNSFNGLKNLRYLYLQENPLTNIMPESFLGLQNLYLLNLTGSSIHILSDRAFSGLTNLRLLNLTLLNVTTIVPGAFNSVNKLNILDLSGNELEILQDKMFDGLDALEKLYLQNNRIKTISSFAFYGLQSIMEINIVNGEDYQTSLTDFEYNTVVLTNNTLSLENHTLDGLRSLGTLRLVNLNIVKVGKGTFNDLQALRRLILKNTTVETIESIALDGLSHRAYIGASNFDRDHNGFYDLGDLSIESIESDAFSNSNCAPVSDHEFYFNLSINNNNIRLISSNTFRNVCSDLSVLRLDNSNVEEIQPFAFDGLTFFWKNYYKSKGYPCNSLYLNNNKISVLKSNAFSKIRNVVKFRLDNNAIREMESRAFNDLMFHPTVIVQENSYESELDYNVLYLNQNNISRISNGTFNNITDLVALRLDNNNIKTIDSGAFSDFRMLEHSVLDYRKYTPFNTIYLNNNFLTSLQKNMFVGIKHLIVLQLHNNKVSDIEIGAFNGLEKLMKLNLNKNQLQSIRENSFLNLQHLEILDLSYNEVTSLNPESFSGLVNLQSLDLRNNKIKELALGTLKNFPLLENLQLGQNELSKFKTGTFSNLGTLKHLNLSTNEFSTLNETVLYPLSNLELLDFDNNNFTYINYSSLLSHLPHLQFISINDNKWSCDLLTHMLKTFRSRGVNYLFNATERYIEENVDGIFCTEARLPDSAIAISDQNKTEEDTPIINNTFEALIPLINIYNDTSHILTEFKQSNNLLRSYIRKFEKWENKTLHEDSEQKYNYIKDSSSSVLHADTRFQYSDSISHHLLLVQIFMLVFLNGMCISLFYMMYKKYFKTIKRRNRMVETRSEFELLGSSA